MALESELSVPCLTLSIDQVDELDRLQERILIRTALVRHVMEAEQHGNFTDPFTGDITVLEVVLTLLDEIRDDTRACMALTEPGVAAAAAFLNR